MRRAYVLLAVPLAVLPGCQMNERMTGTAGGAIAGGVISAATGASFGSVLIVAGAGALVGYLIGDYMADQRERCMCEPAPSQGGCCMPASHVRVAPAVPDASASRTPQSGATWDARVAYEKGRAAATAEEAEAAYQEAIRLDPARPEPWNALALLAIVRGDRTLARSHLQTSLALDPAYPQAKHNLDRLDRGL
jgi:hypothetical protein